jgi:hypothetical protein
MIPYGFHRQVIYYDNSTVIEHLLIRNWRSEFIWKSGISGVTWDINTGFITLWANECNCIDKARQILDELL